jgi:hypothetical protein
MSLTITASQSTATAGGMAMFTRIITGAASSQPGATAGTHGSGGTASQSVTPSGTGSLIFGAILGGSNTGLSAGSGTAFDQNYSASTLRYVQLESVSATTSGTPVTLGAASATTGLSIALCEILAAGTLAEDTADAPAAKNTSGATSLTTASFTPPGGSLLVVMISTNGGSGTTNVTVSDSSGLSWTQQSHQNGGSTGYTGVWTARVPSSGTLLAGVI